MSSIQPATENATEIPSAGMVDLKLEVVVLPVSDVDRAKRFYQGLGWRLDADIGTGKDFRVVQLTPPGSGCSIIFGKGVTSAVPGSVQDLMLVVFDLDAARAELIGRGADVSEVFHDEDGIFRHAGTVGRVPGPDPEVAPTPRGPRSAIRTATAGCSKRSRRGSPDGEGAGTMKEEN